MKNGEIPRIRQILRGRYDDADREFEHQFRSTWYTKMVINKQEPMRVQQLVLCGVL